jgi:alpha-tubulin suppressor-like RCC1 family protein
MTGYNYYGRCDGSGWRDLVAVSAGGYCHTVGLRSDGTAVATGGNSLGQCDVSGWRDLARR